MNYPADLKCPNPVAWELLKAIRAYCHTYQIALDESPARSVELPTCGTWHGHPSQSQGAIPMGLLVNAEPLPNDGSDAEWFEAYQRAVESHNKFRALSLIHVCPSTAAWRKAVEFEMSRTK